MLVGWGRFGDFGRLWNKKPVTKTLAQATLNKQTGADERIIGCDRNWQISQDAQASKEGMAKEYKSR
jgi:hypothetical protein